MNTIEPYIKRPVKFLKLVNFRGWRIKIYGLTATLDFFPEALVTEAMNSVLPNLPNPPMSEEHYGVGFLIIHQGILRNWFLLDWWEYEDVLLHRLFSSPLSNPKNISSEKDSSIMACVHELRVINFESEAWTKTVLRGDSKPNFDEYIKQIFDLDES